MRHEILWPALAVTILAVAMTVGGRPANGGGPAAAVAVPPATRWQYAQLVESADGSRFASPDQDVHGGPSDMPRVSSGELLYKAMGGQGEYKGEFTTLSLIGANGWELVHVDPTGPDKLFFFKRPAAAR